MNIWSRFLATPPAETPIRIPRPSSLGLPRCRARRRRDALCAASAPAPGVLGDHLGVHREPARGDDHRLGLVAPVSVKCFQRRRPRAVCRRQGSSPGLADLHAELVGRLTSRSMTIAAPPNSPGTGTDGRAERAWPARMYGHTFSLPVYDRPSVPGGTTIFPGSKLRLN